MAAKRGRQRKQTGGRPPKPKRQTERTLDGRWMTPAQYAEHVRKVWIERTLYWAVVDATVFEPQRRRVGLAVEEADWRTRRYGREEAA